MASGNGHKLSVQERDRRYSIIKDDLRERGVDAAIVSGSDLFYLTNGLPGERYGLLAADDLPLTVFVNGRHLAEVPPQAYFDQQEWVKDDIHPGNDAGPMVQRIKELALEKGTIGISAAGGTGVNNTYYARLCTALPDATIVDVTDILANIRTIKSEEEIALIDKANRAFDAAVSRVHEVARPGMLGREVVQEAIKAMWDAGADLQSTAGFYHGKVPAQNPVLGHYSLDTAIEPGDLGTMTAHVHFEGYGGHSDAMFSFGEPSHLHATMFDAMCDVRAEVLKHVHQGSTQADLIETYQRACRETQFRSSSHSQIHQYGIDIPEFPGPAFTVRDGAAARSRGNFELKAGMVYSISPTLVAPDSEDTILAGTTVVVGETGPRELGDRAIELLVCD